MTELQKQLSSYKRDDKNLKYLVNYLFTIYDDEQKVIDELIPLGYSESEIVEMLEYDFALDMSWNKFSVNYNHGITVQQTQRQLENKSLAAYFITGK